MACRRTPASVWASEPNLYERACPAWSWKVFELTASKPSPRAAACSRSPAAPPVASVGASHGRWSETRGAAPVRAWTAAASSSLSRTVTRLAGAREASEARAAGAEGPRRDGHLEGSDGVGDGADVDAAAGEAGAEGVEVVGVGGGEGRVGARDGAVGEREGHGAGGGRGHRRGGAAGAEFQQ